MNSRITEPTACESPTTGGNDVCKTHCRLVTENFVLRLYIAGQTPKCMRAFANLKRICEQYLADRYQIEMIDLLKDPALARNDQILAVPTLVRRSARAGQEDHR